MFYFFRFSDDSKWYRAEILQVSKSVAHVKVRYVDYGNEEYLPTSELRRIRRTFLTLPTMTLSVEIGDLKLKFPSEAQRLMKRMGTMVENWTVVFDVRYSLKNLSASSTFILLKRLVHTIAISCENTVGLHCEKIEKFKIFWIKKERF